jgi:hypothetical protein
MKVLQVLRSFQHIVKFKESTFRQLLPSLVTSLNHNVIVATVEINPRVNRNVPLEYPWNVITPDKVVVNKENDTANGHGEASTKWNGCACTDLFII